MVAISDALVTELGLRESSSVEVRSAGTPTLTELVARITPENRHEEYFAGPPVGRELL